MLGPDLDFMYIYNTIYILTSRKRYLYHIQVTAPLTYLCVGEQICSSQRFLLKMAQHDYDSGCSMNYDRTNYIFIHPTHW